MTIETICQIGKVKASDENIEILNQYKAHIESWLASDEFSTNYANSPYPPLVNPAKINYQKSKAAHAWVLNLPLPKYYDFVAFGSHACGFHAAIPSFLMLCGVYPRVMAIRDSAELSKEGEIKGSHGNYLRMYDELVRAQVLKEAGKLKHIYLQLTDLVLDEDTKKFYSFVDAAKCLHVVRDPISILKGMAATPHCIEQMRVEGSDEAQRHGYFWHKSPKELMKNSQLYINGARDENKELKVGEGGAMSTTPDILSIDTWLADPSQALHDGAVFRLLEPSIRQIKLKQTSDFVGDKCYDAMCELADFFGFERPKDEDKWLLKERVSDLKYLTPALIYASDEVPFYDEISEDNKPKIDINTLRRSVKVVLTTRFDTTFGMELNKAHEISGAFELASPLFCVFLESKNDALRLLNEPKLLEKTKRFVRELSFALLEQAKIENTKKFKESDVLEYFAQRKDKRQLMSVIMKQHLDFLSRFKPEIVEGWEHYAKFKQLCLGDEPLSTEGGGINKISL